MLISVHLLVYYETKNSFCTLSFFCTTTLMIYFLHTNFIKCQFYLFPEFNLNLDSTETIEINKLLFQLYSQNDFSFEIVPLGSCLIMSVIKMKSRHHTQAKIFGLNSDFMNNRFTRLCYIHSGIGRLATVCILNNVALINGKTELFMDIEDVRVG